MYSEEEPPISWEREAAIYQNALETALENQRQLEETINQQEQTINAQAKQIEQLQQAIQILQKALRKQRED